MTITNEPMAFVFERGRYPETKAFLSLEAGQNLDVLKAGAQRELAGADRARRRLHTRTLEGPHQLLEALAFDAAQQVRLDRVADDLPVAQNPQWESERVIRVPVNDCMGCRENGDGKTMAALRRVLPKSAVFRCNLNWNLSRNF